MSSLFHNNVCRSKNQGKFTKTGKNFKKKPQTMHFIKLIMLFHEPYILISFLIIRIECYYRAWFVVIVIIHMLLYHLTKKIRKERKCFSTTNDMCDLLLHKKKTKGKCISTTNGMHNYMDGIPDQYIISQKIIYYCQFKSHNNHGFIFAGSVKCETHFLEESKSHLSKLILFLISAAILF